MSKNIIDKPRGLLSGLVLTADAVSAIGEVQTDEHQIIAYGSTNIIVANANRGKTTLLMWLSSKMASEGKDVYYINADMKSTVEVGNQRKYAEDNEFNLIVCNIDGTGTPFEVANSILELTAAKECSNMVIIFDVLSSFVDTMNKTQSRKFFQNVVKKLTARGITTIFLHHSNKDVSEENGDDVEKVIFEGTNDALNQTGSMMIMKRPSHKCPDILELITKKFAANTLNHQYFRMDKVLQRDQQISISFDQDEIMEELELMTAEDKPKQTPVEKREEIVEHVLLVAKKVLSKMKPISVTLGKLSEKVYKVMEVEDATTVGMTKIKKALSDNSPRFKTSRGAKNSLNFYKEQSDD